MADMEFEDIQASLSTRQAASPFLLSRRAFLQAAAAGVGLSMMPGWMQAAGAATSGGSDDKVLVVIQLGGGNDGLNTVIPTGNGVYYDKRKGLAITGSSALSIGPGVGLHPALAGLHKRFAAGDVAVVQGVGYENPELSHFTSVEQWMAGWAAGGVPRSGWLGRYLDGSDGALGSVVIGNSVPLHLQGAKVSATSLPTNRDSVFGFKDTDPTSQRLYGGLRKLAGPTSLGTLGDLVASTNKAALTTAETIGPCYPAKTDGNLKGELSLCARLINAGVGLKVLGVECGSFDTHDGQTWQHNARLTELDEAIDAFYATLDPAAADRVVLMTFSEFGRRVQTSGSGTDHGTASNLFIIGSKVKGGLYGAQPSLTDLDRNGNLKPALSFHSVYASVLDNWLSADSTQVLGKHFETLPIFEPKAAAPAVLPVAVTSPPTSVPTIAVPANVTDSVATPLVFAAAATNVQEEPVNLTRLTGPALAIGAVAAAVVGAIGIRRRGAAPVGTGTGGTRSAHERLPSEHEPRSTSVDRH